MNIIESKEELTNFMERFKLEESLIIPVYSDVHKHPANNKISFIYVYLLNSRTESVIVFNHHESLSKLTISDVVFDSSCNVYVFDKKRLLYFVQCSKFIDIDLISYFQDNIPIDISEINTSAHDFYERLYFEYNDINEIIPLYKHIEKCQSIKNKFIDKHCGFVIDEPFMKYNSIIDNLYSIEKNGLYVDYKLFVDLFGTNGIYNNTAFSEYNMYTTTGRPSNRFGGVNYNALNKENKSRTAFLSRFGTSGFLIQFDYDAFHLRLIAKLINYQFPLNINVHEYLGKQYFDKDSLTEEEYDKSKLISFRQVYGGVSREYQHITFFNKVTEYIENIWSDFNRIGYIETPIYKRKLYRTFFDDMNKNKLFNYILQAFETEHNMDIISRINAFINGSNLSYKDRYKSVLTLYTYDSILFDFHIEDSKDFILKVKEIMEDSTEFPVKMQVGSDYHNMIDVTGKLLVN